MAPTEHSDNTVKIVTVEPAGALHAALDLGEWVLPSGTPLGDTPGKYRLITDYLVGGNQHAWSGMVWSNPIEIEVVECADAQ